MQSTIIIVAGMILFGAAAGALTAAGYFAVITSVGMINRVADVTKTTKYLLMYEEFIIIGAVLGNVLSVFNVGEFFSGLINQAAGASAGTVISVFLAVCGIVSGMFVGLFVVCLAETTKVLPIFLRRVRIGAGLGIIILMIGVGKAIGHIIYYLVLYKGS